MILNENWYKKEEPAPKAPSSPLNDLFLQNGEAAVVRSLLPANFSFPEADTLDEKELQEKVDQILDIIGCHNIEVEYAEETPPLKVYDYLLNTVLPDRVEIPEKNSSSFVTYGCDGYCPECFQKGYCDEDLSDEWDEGGE